jgi:hypothetical protein
MRRSREGPAWFWRRSDCRLSGFELNSHAEESLRVNQTNAKTVEKPTTHAGELAGSTSRFVPRLRHSWLPFVPEDT